MDMGVIVVLIIVIVVGRLLLGMWAADSKEREAQRKKDAAAKAKAEKAAAAQRKKEEAAQQAENARRRLAEAAEQAKKEREAAEKEKMLSIMEPCRPAFVRHAELVKEIQGLYGNSASDPHQDKLISLLQEDASLFPAFVDCNNRLKLAGFDMDEGIRPDFDPFARLADLYESKGQYQQALGVCKDAVALGVAPEANQRHIEILKGRLVQKNG